MEVVHAQLQGAVTQAVALTVVVLAAAGVFRGFRHDRRWAAVLAVVTVGALVLRLVAPAGPIDVNPRSVEVFSWTVGDTWGYGVAYPYSWRTWLPGPLRTPMNLFHGHAVAGALVPAALAGWLRSAGVDRRTALLAAIVLAVLPPHVRWSHTDGPGVAGGLLVCLAGGAMARLQDTPRAADAALFACAGALACTLRPEGLGVLVLYPVLSVAMPGRFPWRHRPTQVAVLVGVAFVALHVFGVITWNPPVPPSRAGLVWPPSPLVWGPRHWPLWDPAWTHPVAIAAAAVGVFVTPGPWPRRLAWSAFFLGLGSFVLNPDWSTATGDKATQIRHHLRAMPGYAALMAFGVAWLGPRLHPRHGLPALGGVLVLAHVSGLPDMLRPHTAHAEHAFFHDAMERVPDGCDVYWFGARDDLEFKVPGHYPEARGMDQTWHRLGGSDAPPVPSGCAYWYRGSECEAVPPALDAPAPLCDDLEAAWPLEPVVEVEVDAHPYLLATYPRDTVRLGLFRVVR